VTKLLDSDRGAKTFFLVAYGASWALWTPLIWWAPSGAIGQALLVAGTFGPGAAAAAIIIARYGRSGLRSELLRQWKWRIHICLWFAIVLGPAAIVLTAIGIASILGAPPGDWNDPSQLYLAIPVFLYVVVFGGPLGEEFGWRGYALPLLQLRRHPTTAVLFLGLAWGLWHLPLFWIEGTVQQQIPLVAYFTQIMATSVIYGWLWNKTKSLPAVVMIHATTNTTVGLLPILPTAADSLIPLWIGVGLAALAALLIVIATHGQLGHIHHEPLGSDATRGASLSTR